MSQLAHQATRPEKIMSSRLMTMKFMQRAAASAPSTTTIVPAASSNGPLSKHQKTASTSSSLSMPLSELDAIRDALEAEEVKRAEAAERQGAGAGETKWVLSWVDGKEGEDRPVQEVAGLRVLRAGYSDIDDENVYAQEHWVPSVLGRRSFGRFNRELEKRQNAQSDHSSLSIDETSGAESEEKDGDSDDPSYDYDLVPISTEEALQQAKAERKAEKKRIKAEEAQLAERRKNAAVELSTLSSISSGGGNSGNGHGSFCYNCGKMGHARKDCMKRSSGKRKIEMGGEEESAKRFRMSFKS